MKQMLLFLGLAMWCSLASAQTSEDSTYIRQNYTKMEKYITMRDGKKLFTSIYLPKDQSKKYPIMMTRTPYTVSPYGENEYRRTLGQNMLFARAGFIFVYQDVRGKWMSEGDYVDVRPIIDKKKSKTDIDESTDTYDTIDWLVKNLPNNNGRVGIEGISYPGFYSSASLPNAHPALKAVSPQAPVTDWFLGDDFHHNGAFMMMDAFNFYTSFGVPRPKPLMPKDFKTGIKVSFKDNYKFYLEMGALPNFKKKYMGDSVKFWNDLMSHPNYDEFWKAMNIRPHLVNIKPATMTVGGFFDAEDCFGALHVYDALEKQNPQTHKNMLVMGPWFHGGWESKDATLFADQNFGSNTSAWFRENIELPFFNYYLKDEGAMDLPEASIFITGSNQWHKFETWPPKNTTEKTLYFQPDGKLSFTPATVTNSFDEYVSDPNTPVPYQDGIQKGRTREYMLDDQRFAARRPDVKVYQTDTLTEDMTLTGPLMADLFASTTGTDADYVVKLIDVFPDNYPNPIPNPKNVTLSGYQMLIRGEVFRGRFRNSFEKPEAFEPGKVTEIKYALPDVGHTFRKGHRIMIQVQNSWFPLVDRNPQKFVDIYQATDADFQKATHRIYHDGQNKSSLKITVLEQ
ncbi:CocE/NonD family hydrolase [Mucilaginibacter flavus]|uniref:CocE/NonD family hydrolase n=1 Tax=Mucilaginibacter flavus TaxID=931504 RepID=UPI0025B4B9E2|nr:CocE/NonD family hydrolase [Mucilaginibacter flavus]MDN3585036.1 CocE/NonD family hydrolase [Mucilaginibacter flavus]